jgi:prolyl 4-hydroxylase
MPPSSFRWRTVLELAAIISAVYIFLGAPGFSGSSLTSGGVKKNVQGVKPKPKPHIRPESLVYPDPDLKCQEHGYDVHIYSTKPLVIYIDGFLSHEEADALVDLR